MERKRVLGLSVVAIVSWAAQAQAQPLREWELPNRNSRPLQIDAQHVAQRVFFLDLGTSGIDLLANPTSGAVQTLFEHHPPSFKGDSPSAIEAVDRGGEWEAYVTDPATNTVGQLADGVYTWWKFGRPIALSYEPSSKNVFFTNYDGSEPPEIDGLDPALGKGIACVLPPEVADPSDRLDGIVAEGPTRIYFSVVGPRHASISAIDPTTGSGTTWPVPLKDPGQIARTQSGQIASVLSSADRMAQILDPATGRYREWQDLWVANSLMPFVSVLPAGEDPWFIGSEGPNVTLLLSSTPTPAQSAAPSPFASICKEFAPPTGREEAPPKTTKLQPIISTLPASTTGAYRHYAKTAATGAISAFNSDQVYFTQTSARRIAWLVP